MDLTKDGAAALYNKTHSPSFDIYWQFRFLSLSVGVFAMFLCLVFSHLRFDNFHTILLKLLFEIFIVTVSCIPIASSSATMTSALTIVLSMGCFKTCGSYF